MINTHYQVNLGLKCITNHFGKAYPWKMLLFILRTTIQWNLSTCLNTMMEFFQYLKLFSWNASCYPFWLLRLSDKIICLLTFLEDHSESKIFCLCFFLSLFLSFLLYLPQNYIAFNLHLELLSFQLQYLYI